MTAAAIGSGTELRDRRSASRVDPAAPEAIRSASRRVQSDKASEVAISSADALPPPSTVGMNTTPAAAAIPATGQPVISSISTPAARPVPCRGVRRVNNGLARRPPAECDVECDLDVGTVGRMSTPRSDATRPTTPPAISSPATVSSSPPAVTPTTPNR